MAVTQRRFPVMVDPKGYPVKPLDVGAVRNRMKAQQPHMYTSTELLALIQDGHTWQPGCYRKGEFVGQQVYALDFDDPDALPLDEALARLQELNMWGMALFAHYSFSATDEKPKYRIALMDDEVATTERQAKETLAMLLAMFPEADQKCSDPNRIFFGSCDKYQALDIDAYMREGDEDGHQADSPAAGGGRASTPPAEAKAS